MKDEAAIPDVLAGDVLSAFILHASSFLLGGVGSARMCCFFDP